jgi:hypothetical protein
MEEYEMSGEGEAIVVTGSRIRREELMSSSPLAVMTAEQEELGDLKLYRIPEAVTVAANSQKQVALLTKPRVRFERLYGADLSARGDRELSPVAILLRIENEKKRGLGVPLPSGTAAVFEAVGERTMLAGEASVEDTAIGQELDLRVGESTQVMIEQRAISSPGDPDNDGEERRQRYEIDISNANSTPVVVETLLRLFADDWRLVSPSKKLKLRNGRQAWRAKVPANGRAKLTYTMERIPVPRTRSREVQEEDEDQDDGEE